MTINSVPAFDQKIYRDEFIQMLQFSLEANLFRYVRQACQLWLATYPGDLEIQILEAKGLRNETKILEATLSVERIVRRDPEYIDAVNFLEQLYTDQNRPEREQMSANLYALEGNGKNRKTAPEWSIAVHHARMAFNKGMFQDAQRLIQPALGVQGDPIVAAIQHLRITRQSDDNLTFLRLAQIYHARWPECLQFSLWYAEAQMACGEETKATSLLHRCAAEDTIGQVAKRLWGEDFPYKPIWPTNLRIRLDIPIPATVATRFGWNSLASGSAGTNNVAVEGTAEEQMSFENTAMEHTFSRAEEPPKSHRNQSHILIAEEPEIDVLISREETKLGDDEIRETAKGNEATIRKEVSEQVYDVKTEFENLARKLQKPGIGRADGRFPMYVILTCREALRTQYGEQTEVIIISELERLAQSVKNKKNWGGFVFTPDDEDCMNQHNLPPMVGSDSWSIKLALADLDRSLESKGEMISAVLIIGGDEVVPFHRLPNPTDDTDLEVLSDNPYATLDSNYFIPEWPVGRIVGENGADASLLLDQIRQIIADHNGLLEEEPGFWIRLNEFLRTGKGFGNLLNGKQGHANFGYTAAVWQRSSLAAYRHIGQGNTLKVSPPIFSTNLDNNMVTQSRLGYFNLHGLVDSPEWYGQRDPMEMEEGPDYPIALTPENLINNSHAPKVVFSEACYGGHVIGKIESESIALRLAGIGTRAIIASTCISYGSVASPLIGADLMGSLFWRYLKDGDTVGDALMRARIDMVREMNKRQGYLDGEDQKTLISFILLGDPLVRIENRKNLGKVTLRYEIEKGIKTVCDLSGIEDNQPKISKEIISQVKDMVGTYLPGMDGATVTIHEQQSGSFAGKGFNLPPDHMTKAVAGKTDNLKITVCKESKQAQHTHTQFARVTLSPDGKMVKLAISR